jgi:transposase
MRGIVVPLTDERDVDTLRQISLLLERENQRLITKNLQLTAELARLRGLPEVAQLTFAVEQTLQQTRTAILDGAVVKPSSPPRPARPGHGPREPPALPIVEIRHELPADQRGCPVCGGTLTELVGQCETAERITTVKATYHVEHHARQKGRCACNGAVVTAPAPPTLMPGGRYTTAFAVGVAVAKYTDHLPLERQVRMMAREALIVESQTLWDQIQALARHLEPTYDALGRQALAAPVIHVDETRWPRLGSAAFSAGTVWGVATPTTAFYRILPGKSADEGRQVLGDYRGTVVVDGYAVYECLARDGPGFALAHCLPRSELGKAVRYMLERWTGLTRFLDNPCISLDNNAAERVLRGPGGGPEESLRLEVAAGHTSRGALLHTVRVGEARGRRPPRVSAHRHRGCARDSGHGHAPRVRYGVIHLRSCLGGSHHHGSERGLTFISRVNSSQNSSNNS